MRGSMNDTYEEEETNLEGVIRILEMAKQSYINKGAFDKAKETDELIASIKDSITRIRGNTEMHLKYEAFVRRIRAENNDDN